MDIMHAQAEQGSRLTSIWNSLVLMTVVGQAGAQESPTQPPDEVIDMIVVTGSRIPRAEFETLQPAVVLDADRLDLRAATSLATALNEQSGFAVPGNSPVDQQGLTVGQNFVNYLGLGFQRTLTLVNGHRFPAGVSPQAAVGGLAVDLNAIPENLVERVETIAVGGAPIYGSDAIAGTVNIILKDNFEGFEAMGSAAGSPGYGDADEYRIGATWGVNFDDGRGNIALSSQFTKMAGMRYTDRPATDTLLGFESPADPGSPYSQQLYDDLVVAVDNNSAFPLYFGDMFFFNIFGNGVALDINDPASPMSQFDANGNLLPFVPGGGTGSIIFQQGGDGLRLSEFSSLNTRLERLNFNVLGHYDLTESTRVKAELWYARSVAKDMVNQPGFNSPAFGGLPANGYGNVGMGPIPILSDNPFLPPATRNAILAALDVVHDFDGNGTADPTIDTDGDGIPDAVGFWRGGPLTNLLGDNRSGAKRYLYRGVISVEGEAAFFGKDYFWNTSFTYGRNESEEPYKDIVVPHFEQAVQVVVAPDGSPACADPSGGCVPLDVIGMPTPDAVSFVTSSVVDRMQIEQRVLSANIGGDVVNLPAGPISGAIGLVFRQEDASYDPNELAENGLTSFRQAPIVGGFDSNEVYIEAILPILGGELEIPLIDRLEFEGAIRWVENSIAGQDTTWTAGLRFRPIEDVEFRGNLTESIRAPSINELFTPESEVFVFASDPCDARFIRQGNVPDVRTANCAADGIVQPFTSFIVNASQRGTVSGNPNLENEVADSRTIGVILQPRFADQLRISVDWFDIRIENAIENLVAEDIMIACYDSSDFPAEPACSLFERDGAGQVISMREGFVNVGLVEFTGLQSVLSYDLDIGRLGSLLFDLNHLYTEKHVETPGSGNSRRLDGEIGYSENRINLGVTWTNGNWTVFNQARWLSSAVFDNADDEFTRDVKGVDSWLIVDTGVAYEWNENLTLQLNIDNLFDKSPPFAATASTFGITTYWPGVRGRYATVTARARF